jgi:hypothetical protein
LPSKVRALHTILASSIPESEVHCLISREGTSASLLDTMYANTEREIASRPDRLNSYTRMIFSRATGRGLVRTALLSLVVLQGVWAGWGGSDSEETESGLFGNSMSRDWLSSSSAISMQLEGCAWGYVSSNDDAGCMENGSQDGTTYWYQMANCRRAQAVFSLYGTDSGSATCSKTYFKESVRATLLRMCSMQHAC